MADSRMFFGSLPVLCWAVSWWSLAVTRREHTQGNSQGHKQPMHVATGKGERPPERRRRIGTTMQSGLFLPQPVRARARTVTESPALH